MGNRTTKKPPTTEPSPIEAMTTTTDHLRTYEAACEADIEMRTIDRSLQARTRQVITTPATGVEVSSVSLESLREVTECPEEMNQEGVRMILECKKDTWKNQELFGLVEEYFENSLKTLDFCAELEKGLRRARDSPLMILVALQQFEEESLQQNESGSRYEKTLEELKKFTEAGSPFTEDFFQIFQSVHKQQMLMFKKLQLRNIKLEKKLRHINAWRKLSGTIFIATCATLLISSALAAAMAAPPIAAALAAASSVPLGSMGRWIDSLWKNYKNELKGQKEVVNSMQVGTRATIKALNSIWVLVEQLESEIKGMVRSTEFALEQEAVRIGIEDIRNKLESFMKNVEGWGLQADSCSREIRKARTVILQRIIKHPNNSSNST